MSVAADTSADTRRRYGSAMTGTPTTAEAPPTPVRRRALLSWALWDWGSSAYSTIVVSFVFAPYLANTVGGPDAALGLSGATWLGISTAAAGVLIAVLAAAVLNTVRSVDLKAFHRLARRYGWIAPLLVS